MAGVTHGTRLDQLRDLERAVRVQIELEELAEKRGRAYVEPCAAYPAIRPPDPAPATDLDPQSPGRTTIVRVPLELIETSKIRTWARANRYNLTNAGRVPAFVVGAFVDAHQ